MELIETFKRVKKASKTLALLSDQQRNEILCRVADAIVDLKERIQKKAGWFIKADRKSTRLNSSH